MSAPQPVTADELATIRAEAEGAQRLEVERGYRVGVTAMDPATMLRLVAEIERLRAQVDRVEALVGSSRHFVQTANLSAALDDQ